MIDRSLVLKSEREPKMERERKMEREWKMERELCGNERITVDKYFR